MRIFGGDKIAGLMTTLKMPESEAIEHSLVSRAIEQAQSKVESWFFDQRKRVVDYDDVVNKQRQIIYERRRKALEDTPSTSKKVQDAVGDEIRSLVMARASEGYSPFDDASQQRLKTKLDKLEEPNEVIDHLVEIASQVNKQRENQFTPEAIQQIEQFVTLQTMDELWMEHLDALDDLREGIGLRGYAQQEPLVEYKKEAFSMFESLLMNINGEVARRVFRIQPLTSPQEPVRQIQLERRPSLLPEEEIRRGKSEKVSKSKKTDPGFGSAFKQSAQQRPAGAPVRSDRKIGRNDPCWCGSSKKFKKCHYPNYG
jgi:preprotein translocase subunit SecA